MLFVLIVLAHDRRRMLHFHVTEHPTAQQLVEAFPWEPAPQYLLRDRDAADGPVFQQRVAGLGMEQVRTAPRSPWQTPVAERLIGSIRREGLEPVIGVGAGHRRRVLARDFQEYPRGRTPLSLNLDCPDTAQGQPPSGGRLWPFRKWADGSTTTSGERPEESVLE